ncbi:SpoIIE family protein phosphatase [bacterium]|nr:SpoIIE family protein phosphatase [bacterium]
MQDGVSSKNTLGGGLGALKRLSDSVEISSAPGKGTVIQCLVSQSVQGRVKSNLLEKSPALEIGFISVPHPAEIVCGDGAAAVVMDKMVSILVTDGLGHGEGAAEASRRAVELFRQNAFDSPTSLVRRIHAELATTRGAALALAQIDLMSDLLTFVGVGNITARIYSRYSSFGCVSIQGIVGGALGSLKPYEYEWSPGSRMLMYSDGILSAAKLTERTVSSANMTAAEIYRDFSRMNDDATVVVVKSKSEGR